jgi:ferrochelatase
MAQPPSYDAILVISFGGPEGPDDVLPFLENVLRGKNVPHERMLEVAEHYRQFGGVSPINAQNRALIAALQQELDTHGPHLPIYWGNRNWHPLLADTLAQMAADGRRRAIAFFTSAYSSYSSCRQYREDIQKAQAVVGPDAPAIDKLRVFYNHPGFIEPLAESLQAAFEQIPPERRESAAIAYTAHSVPQEMADHCRYAAQLTEACRLVTTTAGRGNAWQLVYQSRSGPPRQPWLEPDICDHLQSLHEQGVTDVVVLPIGFVSDHLEVLFDLDTQALALAGELGMRMVRAATAGSHPRFIRMIRELVEERTSDNPQRLALGLYGPSHDVCPADCCLYTPTRPALGSRPAEGS